MANKNQVDILKRGVKYWNSWRKENPHLWPNLVKADLSNLNLKGADFFISDLREANLSNSDCSYANFSGSICIRTNFTNSQLQNANLYIANLNGCNFNSADLSFAIMGDTILVDIDFRNIRNVDLIQHIQNSHLGVNSIIKSENKIPKGILDNCGVTQKSLKKISANIQNIKSNYHSCFISYSSNDEEFVRKIYKELQNNNVKCWFAPENLKTGDRLRKSLDNEIYNHDKLMLVISKNSINSQWVEQEVEKALEKERMNNKTVLFPIAIDEDLFLQNNGWISYLKNTRNITFFLNWQLDHEFERSFNKILNDLKINRNKN